MLCGGRYLFFCRVDVDPKPGSQSGIHHANTDIDRAAQDVVCTRISAFAIGLAKFFEMSVDVFHIRIDVPAAVVNRRCSERLTHFGCSLRIIKKDCAEGAAITILLVERTKPDAGDIRNQLLKFFLLLPKSRQNFIKLAQLRVLDIPDQNQIPASYILDQGYYRHNPAHLQENRTFDRV